MPAMTDMTFIIKHTVKVKQIHVYPLSYISEHAPINIGISKDNRFKSLRLMQYSIKRLSISLVFTLSCGPFDTNVDLHPPGPTGKRTTTSTHPPQKSVVGL